MRYFSCLSIQAVGLEQLHRPALIDTQSKPPVYVMFLARDLQRGDALMKSIQMSFKHCYDVVVAILEHFRSKFIYLAKREILPSLPVMSRAVLENSSVMPAFNVWLNY